jgi:tRNA threonylcarbamoyladenosine biosynthesis protein TsaE
LSEQAAFEIVTHDATKTQAVGAALGACIGGGQVIALRGDLGAGKTTFVQGLARGLGVAARVSSPTFVLVNEYSAPNGLRLIHIDIYRLGGFAPASAAEKGAGGDQATLDEAEAMGLAELLDDPGAVVAVEWAERIAALLPGDHLLLELRYGSAPDERVLRLTAHGPRSRAALHLLRQSA